MFTITLEQQYEKVWLGENPSPDTFPSGRPPLLHQWRTCNAEEPLIINTYNTGTGKTKAALLRLLKRARDIGFHRLDSSADNALLIAPTNELLAQHAHDAEKFCAENSLPYRVVAITRADLDNYQGETHFSEVDVRRGAALHYLIQNARILDNDNQKKVTLFVVNPDIFYYALYFCYRRFDRIPLFQDILTQFSYIIIDELHYYNAKQLANFLFFMHLSKHYGYARRQFCLLTATPDSRVEAYLKGLDFDIGWIKPENEEGVEGRESEEEQRTDVVCALAPVALDVYSIEELQDGIVTLANVQRQNIATWLARNEEGAIISSSLWRINQIYNDLKYAVSPQMMGRLTGAEQRRGRDEAKGKPLILATPTVDIGYNFDRPDKARQNLDFLLLDARSSDECIQRLGRAGRVLGKELQNIPSHVLAVVPQKVYEALNAYEGQSISRITLRDTVVQTASPRHTLYSYIQSGAIAEAFLPIYRLEQMASSADKPDIEELFNRVQKAFAPDSTFKYNNMHVGIKRYLEQESSYGATNTFPAEMDACLKQCEKRLVEVQKKRAKRELWANKTEAFQWLQSDLRDYFTEKARFSFREAFQPPLALVHDPRGLLSSADVTTYDALHIARNYQAKYYRERSEWQKQVTGLLPENASNALVFCDLLALRAPDERIQIGLKLIVGNVRKSDWEEQFVYRSAEFRPTSLYGLEVIALNSSRALDEIVKDMFKERYIPALVAADPGRTLNEMRRFQREGQIFPYELHVTFGDLKSGTYYAVLGTTALLLWAEILPKYRKIDAYNAQKNENDPIIL